MEIILSSGFMYLELTGKELTYVVRPVQENRLLAEEKCGIKGYIVLSSFANTEKFLYLHRL